MRAVWPVESRDPPALRRMVEGEQLRGIDILSELRVERAAHIDIVLLLKRTPIIDLNTGAEPNLPFADHLIIEFMTLEERTIIARLAPIEILRERRASLAAQKRMRFLAEHDSGNSVALICLLFTRMSALRNSLSSGHYRLLARSFVSFSVAGHPVGARSPDPLRPVHRYRSTQDGNDPQG